MDDDALLAAGAAAADELLGLYGLSKAEDDHDILDDDAFVLRVKQIGRRLDLIAAPAERTAAKRALRALDVDWVELTPAERARALEKASRELAKAPSVYMPTIQADLELEASKLVPGTRKAMWRRYRFRLSARSGVRDEKVAACVVKSETFFIRDAAGRRRERLSEKAREIVATGLEQGLGPDDIGQQLSDVITSVGQPRSYWDTIANNFAARARTYTQVETLEEVGFKDYRFVAVMDRATSSICRYMNGRIFHVHTAVKRIRRVEELEDPEDIGEVLPFVTTHQNDEGQQVLGYTHAGRLHAITTVTRPTNEDDDPGGFSRGLGTAALERAGVQLPPLHFRCRSSIVPA